MDKRKSWGIKMFVELINTDKRGKIYGIVLDKIYWLSYTNKDYGRGGDIHNGQQFNIVLKGKFLVKMRFPTEEVKRAVLEGQSIVIPDNVPHVFIALEDSIMIEWHDHKLPPYKDKRFYEPYRRLCGVKQNGE